MDTTSRRRRRPARSSFGDHLRAARLHLAVVVIELDVATDRLRSHPWPEIRRRRRAGRRASDH